MRCRSVVLVAGALPALITAASLEEPHFHRGKLSPYQLGKPNLLISGSDEQRLRHGESVMQAVAADDGSRRMIAVQDIDAPVHVVMGCGPPRGVIQATAPLAPQPATWHTAQYLPCLPARPAA